jgi:hypothetical protein
MEAEENAQLDERYKKQKTRNISTMTHFPRHFQLSASLSYELWIP